MTRSPIVPILALAFLAAPALACGNGECEPPVKKDPPVVVEPPPPPPPAPPVVEPPVAAPISQSPDREPSAPQVAIHFGYCCQVDGKMRVSTAWLRDPVKALEHCRAREERLQSLPECPDRIQRQEGGE
jgi:hypothetical protein